MKKTIKSWKFNINCEVSIKLTDHGYDILVENYNKYCQYSPSIKRVDTQFFKDRLDENGYFKTQMWHVMQIFGDHIGMGNKNPFETTIIILDNDLTDPTYEKITY